VTNFLIILLLGGAIGWVFTAWRPDFASRDAVTNVLVGLTASMAGAVASQPSLYSGLTGQTFAYSISASLIALGALGLIRPHTPR
jgi:uncharacterized membrane protein YeaQ/YmgE (transglycosylase-associated protein family)